MTQATYTAQLNKISQSAQNDIQQILSIKKAVTIFTASNDAEDEDWTVDIYDDAPDVPFYDRHGFVEYAAVKELHFAEGTVVITGILKGDCYPKQVQVTLHELDSYSSAALADYLHATASCGVVTAQEVGPFYVIEAFPYPQFVMNEEGITKSFDSYEAAQAEADDCQNGWVISF